VFESLKLGQEILLVLGSICLYVGGWEDELRKPGTMIILTTIVLEPVPMSSVPFFVSCFWVQIMGLATH
jgi:hypothetical protein